VSDLVEAFRPALGGHWVTIAHHEDSLVAIGERIAIEVDLREIWLFSRYYRELPRIPIAGRH
jgi:hypothetical protein